MFNRLNSAVFNLMLPVLLVAGAGSVRAAEIQVGRFGSDPDMAGAIAIMTDTDNTGSGAEAWYGEISLSTDR